MQQQDLVTLTIDGREVSVPKGTTVLHAAERLGIEIPTFCYSKKMDPLGACRMCLVSIEKAKGFPPACATPVAPGMVVRTTAPDVVKTQQGMLEFLLINHPLDCPICDKGGECPLQNLTFKYGPGKSRYTEEKRHFVKHLPIGPQIVLDRERCIVCQLCVRFMDDVADDPQIVLLSRGGKTEVNVFPDRPFDSPFAGNTIELCPVGALTSRKYRFKARPWDLQHAPSVCPSCAVGCNVTLDSRRNDLLRLVARENLDVDDGWLCDYGRFGTLDRLHEGERIKAPMVRRNGVLEEVSWDEALMAAASGLGRAVQTGVAALAGPRSTNEELYLLGRLFRSVLRSPNVAVTGGSPAPTSVIGGGSISALEQADAILLFDADPIARQHVLDLRIKKQVKRRDVPLVIVANEPTGLDYLARAKAPFNTANPAETVTRLLALLKDGQGSGPETSNDLPNGNIDSVASAISAAADTVGRAAREVADGVASVTQNVAETLVETARGIVGGSHADGDELSGIAAVLRNAKNAVVLYDERLFTAQGYQDLSAALVELAGVVAASLNGKARPLALASAANSRGAAEMGAHGSWLAGGAAQSDAESAAKLAKAWGVQPATGQGRNATEIVTGLRQGNIQGLLLLNSDPISEGVAEALEALESASFVVLQASRTSPALSVADVVFPATDYAETAGTFTNTEGRVQRIHAALTAPNEVREGWQIITDLATALDADFRYVTGEDVTQEIARVTGLSSWAGILKQAVEPVATGGVR